MAVKRTVTGTYPLRRMVMISSQPHLATSSGSLVSISKAEPAPMKNCIVTFGPIQEGTGTPSPSNVRNISGRTGLSVHVSAAESGGTEYPVTWQTAAGTVYGGTVDLATGELKIDYYCINCTPEGIQKLYFDSSRTNSSTFTFKARENGYPDWTVGTMISNRFSRSYSGEDTPWKLEQFNWSGGQVYFKIANSELTTKDVAGAREWFVSHPTVFVTKATSSVTYQLDPVTIRTLRGTNCIWSDAGSVSATYWTH